MGELWEIHWLELGGDWMVLCAGLWAVAAGDWLKHVVVSGGTLHACGVCNGSSVGEVRASRAGSRVSMGNVSAWGGLVGGAVGVSLGSSVAGGGGLGRISVPSAFRSQTSLGLKKENHSELSHVFNRSFKTTSDRWKHNNQ